MVWELVCLVSVSCQVTVTVRTDWPASPDWTEGCSDFTLAVKKWWGDGGYVMAVLERWQPLWMLHSTSTVFFNKARCQAFVADHWESSKPRLVQSWMKHGSHASHKQKWIKRSKLSNLFWCSSTSFILVQWQPLEQQQETQSVKILDIEVQARSKWKPMCSILQASTSENANKQGTAASRLEMPVRG